MIKRIKLQKKETNEETCELEDLEIVADCDSYILFLDKKVVTIYTNNLAHNPVLKITPGNDPDAISAIRGLSALYCWTGTESLNCTRYMVSSFIVAHIFGS